MDSVLKFLIKLQADGGNVLTVSRQTCYRDTLARGFFVFFTQEFADVHSRHGTPY